MKHPIRTASLMAALTLAALATLACQPAKQPAPKASVQAPQPKLLDTHLAEALKNQTSLIERAEKLRPDPRLPMPMAHSAGAGAVAALAAQEAAPPKPTAEEDKRSLAIWFSGNEVGETDPCG